jgi:hypothetical protein
MQDTLKHLAYKTPPRHVFPQTEILELASDQVGGDLEQVMVQGRCEVCIWLANSNIMGAGMKSVNCLRFPLMYLKIWRPFWRIVRARFLL